MVGMFMVALNQQGCNLVCKRMRRMSTYETTREATRMPHQPILSFGTFQKWGADFVGPFNPPSLRGFQYILVTIDYKAK